jgi:ATP-dependent exoDNAse (exonuclease V) beta subunit
MSEPSEPAVVQPSLFSAPTDQDARDTIVTALDKTLFVEAGAGSGKTSCLVQRVVALVRSGTPMARIAAITFTEKAAAELRDRIRRELEDAHLDDALADLDGAAICTLHAFAHRLLSEQPIEAGLPPGVEVFDEIGSQVAFDDRWHRFIDRLLDDPALSRPLLMLTTAGMRLERLRDIAVACNANWDLVADRMLGDPGELPDLDVQWLAKGLEAIAARRDECITDDDLLLQRLDELEAYASALRSAPDDYAALELLSAEKPSFKVRIGRKGNWRCDIEDLRKAVTDLAGQREEQRRAVSEVAAKRLAREIADFTVSEAEARRRSGELEFHDLLVLARAMLRDPEHGWSVRKSLRNRYTHLLLDEFQDTDPIQCDIAVLLASGDPEAGEQAWEKVTTDQGRLFVVGDPKQSIYRFRRADIAAFLAAQDAFDAEAVQLTCNFRTTKPVIDWCNHVFAQLITFQHGSQPEYRPLDATRSVAPSGPSVVLLGVDPHQGPLDADGLRELEATDVVAAISTALEEGWTVNTGDGWRPCRRGDICVLLPARTSLGHLEDALERAGIAYRAETSSLVYGSREIRDLLAVLTAVDDPTDELALVTALRTPLLGCGDDDLYTFRVNYGGRWDHQADLPESLPADHPVAVAIVALRGWHDMRLWSSPSELLDKIVRDRRMLELAFAHGRPRDLWRRARYVVDQARAFAESKGGNLRDFLQWADLQSAEGARVVETVLPETDDDAVRILTIHGAKGLEFPITILSGMTTQAQQRPAGVRVVFPPDGGYGLKIGRHVTTEEFERFQPIDEQMDFDEKLRLLYVGATRARDHLVVSVHRRARTLKPEPTTWTHAELLWDATDDTGGWVTLAPVAASAPETCAIDPVRPPLPPFADWQAERDAALARSGRSRVRAATAIAAEAAARDPGLAKEPRDLDLPPWNKGRYGTAIGRAVHAVLQTIDLRTGDGIVSTARAQAAAEGVIGREADIEALARSALESATVRAAVESQYWRETYVAAPVGEHTLEGYVDLIYRDRESGGLIVVDYKTDALADDDLDRALARYRLQGASYALAVSLATGQPIVGCVFVFLSPAGAREREVVDLDGAITEVRSYLATNA